MTHEVRHERHHRRFVVTVGAEEAFLAYELRVDGVLVLEHTFTPLSLRGRGIAREVVRAALEYARNAGLSVDPQCWYAARFIARHPEYQDLVTDPDR